VPLSPGYSHGWTARSSNPEYQQKWLDGVQLEGPQKPHGQQYGYGIAQLRFAGNAVYFHGGELPGFNSFIGRDPINDAGSDTRFGTGARRPGTPGGPRRARPVRGPPCPGGSRLMSAASSVAVAVTFVWLGMVLAISFLEAPLKFRAPEVTPRIGLGIGRLVFRALNTVEAVLAATIVVSCVLDPPPVRIIVTLAVAIATLVAQLLLVRPLLTRRSNALLAGRDAPRSHAHYTYVALEATKVLALLVGGVLLLAA
jgi:hypothetical protein